MDEINIVVIVGIIAFVVCIAGLIIASRRKQSKTAIAVWATVALMTVIAVIAYQIVLPL